MRFKYLSIALLACSTLACAAGARVAGYFPYWLQYSQFTPEDVRYDFLTEVRYASMIPSESGELTFADESDAPNMEKLAQLAEENKVNFIISVGGAGNEDAMRALTDDALMSAFVNSAKQALEKYKGEGIEIDWIPEEDSDFEVFKKVVSALADAGVAVSANLSADASKASSYSDVFAKFSSASVYFTDQSSAESSEKVEVNANLKDAQNVLEAYISAGLSAEKIVPIVPMYGKTFYNAKGLGSSFEGAGSGNEGAISYKELMKSFDGPDYQVTFDEASWSEVAVSATETITFTGIPSLKNFATYVKEKGMGGIALYDLSGDHNEPIVSLMVTVGQVLRPEVNYQPKKKKSK
ncbi:MAG: glycoside hydrolase family 18 protein [Fibrobacter sp.]|nr:glycoside hydrolase family 18 protein [Fibrobacter sp.]